MKLQLRHHPLATVRFANAEQDGKSIVGTAIPYGSLSRNLGGFVERFMPGSVSDSVAGGLLCALLNHDTSQPLGDQKAGTLRLHDSSAGLEYDIQTPDTTYAKDALAIMKQRGGAGTGASFGFDPVTVAWSKESGQNVAEVRKARLGEISVLTGMPPAYANTTSSVRSLVTADDQGEIDILDRYGIDLNLLASAFTALKRGLPLTTQEEQTTQQARNLFATARRPILEAANQRAQSLLLV